MGHLLKLGVLAEALEKSVVGDTAAHVMNVVHSDIAREPMQDSWQIVERTSTKPRGVEVPGATLFPIGVLELVLDVEEPYPGRGCNRCDRELHHQKRLKSHGSAHPGDHGQDHEVRHKDAGQPSSPGPWEIGRKSVPYDEEVDRTYTEEYEGIPVEP